MSMPPEKTFRVVEKNFAETIGGEFSYAQKSSALLNGLGDSLYLPIAPVEVSSWAGSD
jgi:hypothetical protein